MTNVLSVYVDRSEAFDNNPSLRAVLDGEPPQLQSVPHQVFETDGGKLFFAEQDGFVHFVLEAQGGGGALGGEVTLEDGTVYRTNGGWSSRAGVVNRYVEHPVVDVAFRTPRYKNNVLLAGALLASVAAEHMPEGMTLAEVHDNGDLRFDAVYLDGRCVKCDGTRKVRRGADRVIDCRVCGGDGIEWE
jgi:hypothetical protein